MKIDFPLNTELPTRDGEIAVLYEFLDGRWFGRKRSMGSWLACSWDSQGKAGTFGSDASLDLLPPKRKAWVVWGPRTTEIYCNPTVAATRADEVCGYAQEITEP